MNTYTLQEGRQKAAMLKAEEKKRLKGIKFFITDYPNMILLKIPIKKTISKF
ncbi:MAG: hypothetical protein F6K17_04745 [Okeania sp. SIO3C4]|nr:hypothetical protein [Okeania sp. SIO3C4]